MFKIDHNIPYPDKGTNAAAWKKELNCTFNTMKEGDSFEATIPEGFDDTVAKWACKVRQAMSEWNRQAYLAAKSDEPKLVLRSRTQSNGLVRVWKIRNPYL